MSLEDYPNIVKWLERVKRERKNKMSYDEYYEDYIDDGMDEEEADQMASLDCSIDEGDDFWDED